jgi:DNA-binding beta-propeller fold protein YncE
MRCEMNLRRITVRVFIALLVLTSAWVLVAFGQAVKPVVVITGDEFMGKFSSPGALFFDEVKKRLYIADSGNSRLVSLDSEFEYLSELSHENVSMPTSVVKTIEGLFFVVDGEKAEIKLIDVRKELVEHIELKGLSSENAGFLPGRLALDGEGRLYVTDRISGNIVIADQRGSVLKEIKANGEGFFGFTDVRVDGDGNVYAVDTIGARVYVFGKDGEQVSEFGKRGDVTGGFRFPTSIAVDSKGLVYVLDRHAGNILVFKRSGTFQFTIAGPGPKQGQLYNPSYIFIDNEDRVYTIDGGRIQVFRRESE